MREYDKATALRAIGPGRWVAPALLLDVVLITALTVLTRAIYGFDPGYLNTFYSAWPFLVGALFGWVVMRAWRRPLEVASAGLPIWALAVIIGVALRVATGEATRVPFIVVATVLLGIVLLGWRAVAKRVARAYARRVIARTRLTQASAEGQRQRAPYAADVDRGPRRVAGQYLDRAS